MVLLGNRANGDPVAPIAVAEDAVHVMRLVEAMGLIEPSGPLEEFGTEALRRVAEAAAAYGIGPDLARVIVDPRSTDGQRHRALGLLRAALEEAPAPRPEARSLLQMFGPGRARRRQLAGAAAISLRRYAAGVRGAPDDVAGRLHVLARIVGELRGAYNDQGIRRWFERRRTTLDDRTPQELLAGGWHPAGDGPGAVLALARSLNASAAT